MKVLANDSPQGAREFRNEVSGPRNRDKYLILSCSLPRMLSWSLAAYLDCHFVIHGCNVVPSSERTDAVYCRDRWKKISEPGCCLISSTDGYGN